MFPPHDEVKINGLIAQANRTKNAEFEVRSKVSKDEFKQIFNTLKESKNHSAIIVEQSINFINKLDKHSKIKKMNFKNGINKLSDEFYEKSVINDYHIGGIKFALSTETKIPKFELTTITAIRIKFRISFVYPTYRYDMTMIKNADAQNLATLKSVKNEFLIDEQTVVDDINKIPISTDAFELEIEFTGKVNYKDLVNAISTIDKARGNVDQDYQETIYRIASLITPSTAFKFKTQYGLKKLTKQVVGLDSNNYTDIYPNLTDFILYDKVDGKRGLLVIEDDVTLLTDKLTIINSSTTRASSLIVLDVEYYEERVYVFDVLVYDGTSLVNNDYSERMKYFKKIEKLIAPFGEIKHHIEIKSPSDIKTFYLRKKLYEVDGLIFNSKKGSYYDMEVYKWKPESQLTIDFMLKKAPKTLIGLKPFETVDNYTIYFLFVGINFKLFKQLGLTRVYKYNDMFPTTNEEYFPIQFSVSDLPYAYIYYHPNNGKGLLSAKAVKEEKTETKVKKVGKKTKGGKTAKAETAEAETAEAETETEDATETVPDASDHDTAVSADTADTHNDIDPNSLDGRVCEMKLVKSTDNINTMMNSRHNLMWQIEKIRTDRDIEVARGNYFGNDYVIAEKTYMSRINPLTLDGLVTPTQSYFQETNDDYKAQRNFVSFVKNIALGLSDVNKREWLLEIASGKGQDLSKIANLGYKNVLFTDNDKNALQELVRRKLEPKHSHYSNNSNNSNNSKNDQSNRSKNGNSSHGGMNILTSQIDYTKPPAEILSIIDSYRVPSVNVVSCQLAIHYLIQSLPTLRNVFKIVDTKLMPSGYFIFSCFDGQRVFDALKDKDEYQIHEGEILKFSIKKEYKSPQFSQFGQKVGVKLPFSKNEYYSEYLVNVDYVIQWFESHKYSVEQSQYFDELLPNFKKENPSVYAALSDADKEYMKLYRYVVLYKLPNNLSK